MSNKVISFRLNKENVDWLDQVAKTEINSDRTKVLNLILTTLRESNVDMESTGLNGLMAKVNEEKSNHIQDLLKAINKAKLILQNASK